MENINAELVSDEERYFIQINDEPIIRIPISEDDAIVVKAAFNALIRRLRKGPFQIALKEEKNDLFYQVATEYIGQLNGELSEIYEEVKRSGFIDIDVEKEES